MTHPDLAVSRTKKVIKILRQVKELTMIIQFILKNEKLSRMKISQNHS